MGKKISQKEAETRFQKNNFQLLDNYVNNSTKVKTKCYCNNIFYAIPSSIFNRHTKSCGCLFTKHLTDKRNKYLQNNDISGKKFGMLTAIEYNNEYWKCICDCGKITYAKLKRLKNGSRCSCGCFARTYLINSMIGKIYSKLTVLKYGYTKNKDNYWKCKCECGRITFVITSKLRNGHTKTCGKCQLKRNKISTSYVALQLHKKLIDFGYPTTEEDHHNYKTKNGKYIDIAIPEWKIAIEYDSKYYHKNKKSEDLKRVKELQSFGWKILKIRSDNKLPKISTINKKIEKLKNNSIYEVITCSDWY